MPRKKIALVGGGQIGGALALMLAQHELGDVVLIDTPANERQMQGKALDIMGFRPQVGQDVEVTGSGDFAAMQGADLVVVTAGVARRPGMTREDLLGVNLGIIRQVAEAVGRYAPEAVCIVTTNPLDTIVYAFHQVSGMPHQHVIGMAGTLDTARFRTYLAMEGGFSVKDVSCLVMGGHGPSMLPLVRTATVGGVPVTELLHAERIEAVVERTRNAGTEIVQLLGNGSAFMSPAAAIFEMVESVLKDKKRLMPAAVYCQGQFGVDGYFMGVPCILGAGGVERIVEFNLSAEEQAVVATNLSHIKASVSKAGF